MQIVKYPNKILNTKCETIHENSAELKKLISDMFDTLRSTGGGVGLAAPQVGVNLRLFITKRFFIDGVYINPVIVSHSEETASGPEGCLSIPGRNYNIRRYTWIKVTYLNERFEKVEKKYTGFPAILFQHEYDHLRGITLKERSGEVAWVKENYLKDFKDYNLL